MPPELRRIAGPDKEWLLDMHLGEAVFMARTMGLVEEEKARERFGVGGGRRDDGVEGNGNDCDDSTAPTPATGPVPSRPSNGDDCERIASPFRRHADLGGLRLHLTVAPREGLGAVRRWEGTLQVKNISGFEPVTPEDQLALVRLLKPDFYSIAAEEASLKAGPKPSQRSAEASSRALQVLAEATPGEFNTRLIANIQGGSSREARLAALECVREQGDRVWGAYVGGLFSEGAECLARAHVMSLVKSVLPSMPLLAACHNPVEALEAVGLGIDVLQCSFPEKLARDGRLLTFETAPDTQGAAATSDVCRPLEGTAEDSEEGREGQSANEARRKERSVNAEGDGRVAAGEDWAAFWQDHAGKDVRGTLDLYDPQYVQSVLTLQQAGGDLPVPLSYLHQQLTNGELVAEVFIARFVRTHMGGRTHEDIKHQAV
eukprot:GHVU01097811.1.p1 GENE.GHVU01097811.1~~GHVU01097811.1.p1  ORF type:complete len:431 (+),score=80.77 GHVU01097811.1:670-1962(+)